MLKIIIDGESRREKAELNNFKDADFEIMMRCGNNFKTWITIIKDDKEILRTKLCLNSSHLCKNLKTLLLEDIERDLNYCIRQLEELNLKNYDSPNDIKQLKEYIEQCNNCKLILQAMDNKGNLNPLYNYTFYHKNKKVWEYTLNELQEDKYTETTIKILCGEEKGYGEPIPNCKKEDIIVRIKELQVSI